MATQKQNLAHARTLLQKRAELAKQQEVVRNAKVKQITIKAQIAQIRGKK